jgi:hypothetical protein
LLATVTLELHGSYKKELLSLSLVRAFKDTNFRAKRYVLGTEPTIQTSSLGYYYCCYYYYYYYYYLKID